MNSAHGADSASFLRQSVQGLPGRYWSGHYYQGVVMNSTLMLYSVDALVGHGADDADVAYIGDLVPTGVIFAS